MTALCVIIKYNHYVHYHKSHDYLGVLCSTRGVCLHKIIIIIIRHSIPDEIETHARAFLVHR